MIIRRNQIDLSVAGPGFGEGILVNVGGKLLIGIDCCGELSQVYGHRGASLLDQEVERLDSDAQIVWIITHFHYDHFAGLSTVLERYGPRIAKVLMPTDYTSADVGYAAAKDVQQELSSAALFHLARGEYARVRNLLMEEPLASRCVAASGRIELIRETILWGDLEAPLNIAAVGPLPRDLSKMVGRAASRLRNLDKRALDRANANEGSYIISIECEKFFGLFLGDSPADKTTSAIRREFFDKRISVLKVAHHGAEDGTNAELLETVLSHDSAPAIIAPFKKHGLPRDGVQKLLKDNGFIVKVAGNSSDLAAQRQALAEEAKHLLPITIEELRMPLDGVVRCAFRIFE